MKSSGKEKENLNHVAFLVLRVNLLKGKGGQESQIKLTEFRGSVHIGFIDIGLLQLKEKGLQPKKKKGRGKVWEKKEEEGKYERKKGRRGKAQQKKKKKYKREIERESPSCLLVGVP